jgi:hypothetical protein
MSVSVVLLLFWVQAASAVRVLLVPAEQQIGTAPTLPKYNTAGGFSLLSINIRVIKLFSVCQRSFLAAQASRRLP